MRPGPKVGQMVCWPDIWEDEGCDVWYVNKVEPQMDIYEESIEVICLTAENPFYRFGEMSAVKLQHWEEPHFNIWIITDSDKMPIEWCPKCERKEISEGDYLCHECRFGLPPISASAVVTR